jgi:hypothetical protein
MLRNTKKYKSRFAGLSESGDSVRFGGLGVLLGEQAKFSLRAAQTAWDQLISQQQGARLRRSTIKRRAPLAAWAVRRLLRLGRLDLVHWQPPAARGGHLGVCY